MDRFRTPAEQTRIARTAPFMADIVKQKLEAMDYVYASPAMRAPYHCQSILHCIELSRG